MRAIIYARVSTEEQKKGYSIEAQIEACKKYCESVGWEIVGIKKDEGKSGTSIKKRKALKEAISLIKEGKADILVAHKLDRITRSVEDYLWLRKVLDKGDYIGMFSVSEPLDPKTAKTAFGKFLGVSYANASEYIGVGQVSDRTKLSLKKARESGKKPGWRKGKSRIPEWKKEKIKELFENEGKTYREIAKELNVSLSTISRILSED